MFRALLFTCLTLLICRGQSFGMELVTPLEGSAQFQLSHFRQETDPGGQVTLVFDFKRTAGDKYGTYFVKGKSANGYLSVSAVMPGNQASGSMTLRSFVPTRGTPELNIELFVTQMHTVGEKAYVYSMVSNPIRMGNPGDVSKPRPWSTQETEGYEKYLAIKPNYIKRYEVTADIPAGSVKVPLRAKLTDGTKLAACYQSKWSPITTLSENADGSVHVRWDKWGETYDCNMLRDELVITKASLSQLQQHPESHFPEVPPSLANVATESTTESETDSATQKPRKDYPVSIDTPADSVFVPDDAKLPSGTALQACYAGTWNPITHLSDNDDGTLTVRWDDYGPAFDCSMLREQLIIKSTTLRAVKDSPLAVVDSSNPLRTWTDATGKFKVQAKLIRRNETSVTLEINAGKEVTLPLNKLSQADQDYLSKDADNSVNPFE